MSIVRRQIQHLLRNISPLPNISTDVYGLKQGLLLLLLDGNATSKHPRGKREKRKNNQKKKKREK
jgi:hypothetical protein